MDEKNVWLLSFKQPLLSSTCWSVCLCVCNFDAKYLRN